MTKPQIWIAFFLALFIILFALEKLLNSNETNISGQKTSPMSQSQISSKEVSVEELMGNLGCLNCHGADLTGTERAPSLLRVKQYWSSREELINYFRNPSSYMDNDRFLEYLKKYPKEMMPPFNKISVQELGRIADYLLSK